MAESSSNQETDPRSDTSLRAMEAASYLLRTSLEMQSWSGSLDWSKRLVHEGVLVNPAIIRSFSNVRRVDFLPDRQKLDEGYDFPIAIGYNQTNSQPSLVGKMLELLKPRRGQNILDVGSGSGWTTALLASVTGREGRVIGTERIPELVDFAKGNLAKYNFPHAEVRLTEHELGVPTEGPYSRILVSAHMLERWIPELGSQLSSRGGMMIAPVSAKASHDSNLDYSQTIVAITRNGNNFTKSVCIEGVGFVPLIHDDQPVD